MSRTPVRFTFATCRSRADRRNRQQHWEASGTVMRMPRQYVAIRGRDWMEMPVAY